ncbi:MAG: hypothetical protein JXX29_08115 [Deltaproteobacteria bacterium]|nr:hypothetical protein [Deltaproteobacteria bacterium]MBN2671624.1 hypothetical protein [Deltaproteobacteria bacterium]
MKIADATIEIRPRSASELVDTAVLFYRTHFPLLFSQTAVFGFPAVVVAMSIHYLTHSAFFAIAVLMVLLSLLTGAVVASAGRIVFGSRLTLRESLGVYRSVWGRYFGRKLWENIVCLLFLPVVIGYAWHLAFSYTAPVGILEQLRGRDLRIRRKGLLRRGGGNSFVFDFQLILVVTAFAAGAICLLELTLGNVFTLWQDTGLRSEEVLDDPMRLGIWMAAVVVVCPIYSLGWFFRYLDARIRAEGWDLELDFRRAAQRLEEGNGSER